MPSPAPLLSHASSAQKPQLDLQVLHSCRFYAEMIANMVVKMSIIKFDISTIILSNVHSGVKSSCMNQAAFRNPRYIWILFYTKKYNKNSNFSRAHRIRMITKTREALASFCNYIESLKLAIKNSKIKNMDMINIIVFLKTNCILFRKTRRTRTAVSWMILTKSYR